MLTSVFLLKLFYVFLSFLLILLPLTHQFPQLLTLFPSWRRILNAYNKICHSEGEREVIIEDKTHKIKGGYVKEGEAGFKELFSVIKRHKNLLNEGKPLEIGLAYGPLPLTFAIPGIEASYVISRSGSMIYLIFQDKEGKNRILSVAFSPYENSERLSHELYWWLTSFMNNRIALYTLIVAILWIVNMVLIAF